MKKWSVIVLFVLVIFLILNLSEFKTEISSDGEELFISRPTWLMGSYDYTINFKNGEEWINYQRSIFSSSWEIEYDRFLNEATSVCEFGEALVASTYNGEYVWRKRSLQKELTRAGAQPYLDDGQKIRNLIFIRHFDLIAKTEKCFLSYQQRDDLPALPP